MIPIKKEINPNSSALIIFIRNPELGKVKTRLAKDVGPERALEIYHRLLKHTRQVALELDVPRHLFYHERIQNDQWPIGSFKKSVQVEGDLGDKMKDAFSTVLKKHQKAIIIGSDCAQLNSDIIASAIEHLDEYDTVIGPTYDGGYYLIGMKNLHTPLFENMEWSVSSVFSETLSRISALNLTYYILPKLADIDYIEDWNRYGLDT